MNIRLNDREEHFDRDKISVSEMLSLKKFSFRLRIIKINDVLVPADKYDSTIIQEGDKVQMLYLMSGG